MMRHTISWKSAVLRILLGEKLIDDRHCYMEMDGNENTLERKG